ncbi:hypothetical protein, partial [Mailhella sp.]|uniref:hypothetical protein n=1 Tax=Mailhella sp. TaxID=1981029 RepID=UPI003AB6E3BD
MFDRSPYAKRSSMPTKRHCERRRSVSALLKQRKHFHAAWRGRRGATPRGTANGKRRVLQSLSLLGKGFKIAARQGDQRRAESFNIQGTQERTHAANIVTHSHRKLLKNSLIFCAEHDFLLPGLFIL